VFEEKIQHAQFTLPTPPTDLPAKHPLKNEKTHNKLLDYIKQRLDGDKDNRDLRIQRYAQIDRDVAAWLRLNDEDRKRAIEHERNGTPEATAISLPLTWVHLDDMMTYLVQSFAPIHGMFYHTAGAEDTDVASQLVALMNNHAIHGSYYRHFVRALFNLLKYNTGGVINTWAKEYGPKLVADAQGNVGLESQTVFAGNLIKAIDQYNFFYDPSVEPTMLHKEGEWFAIAEMKSHYWLKKKCLEETFFNCETLLGSDWNRHACDYYRDPPVEARLDEAEVNRGSAVNWYSFMSGTDSYLVNNAFELVTMYIKINPNDFNLVGGTAQERNRRNRYETWRITICNGDTIIGVQHLNNVHDHLPAYFGVVNDDFMREAAKSPAEILNPLQGFSSFLLNAHVLANRKNIYGTTFYDPSCVDYESVPEGEVAAKVPLKAQAYGRDIRSMVFHDSHTLDTKQTLQDLEGMLGIINQFFPTQSLPSQIASIDRAVDSQVAAVQQGSTRRQQKTARVIDDTMMRPLRMGMYYNIIQYQEDGVEVGDYFKDSKITIDLSKLREFSIAHLIGQGLKSMDRQFIAQMMQQAIFAMIQAPAVVQATETSPGIDLLKMFEFWLSMMDANVDMNQFRLPATPPAAATPAAGPAGAAIQPATAPEAVTEPIYGS
jgi:hypothetical protein